MPEESRTQAIRVGVGPGEHQEAVFLTWAAPEDAAEHLLLANLHRIASGGSEVADIPRDVRDILTQVRV